MFITDQDRQLLVLRLLRREAATGPQATQTRGSYVA
jgi:hypothetical protein